MIGKMSNLTSLKRIVQRSTMLQHQCIRCQRQFSTHPKPRVTIRNALHKPTPYIHGWAWQHVLLEGRLQNLRNNDRHDGIDTLLLLEHEPVYTLGRGASEQHLTFLDDSQMIQRLSKSYRGEDCARLQCRLKLPPEETEQQQVHTLLSNVRNTPIYTPDQTPIYRIERGGEVTYHGPGQLVFYPMLNLRRYHQDLHWYLRQIEQVIIDTLTHYNIDSNRDNINSGVWIKEDKIAAVGVSSSRWITTHGCALNVCTDLNAFGKDVIRPCGIEERGVTSMKEIMGEDCPSVKDVAKVVVKCFSEVFDVDLVRGDDIIENDC
jgi:lipoyl(octanoyl) transferase